LGPVLDRIYRIYARIVDAFPDRELYVRSNGRVRFLRVSQRAQLRAAALVAIVAIAWLGISGTVMISQVRVASQHAAIRAESRAIIRTANSIDSYRASIEDRAARVEARQQTLDRLAGQYFGEAVSEDVAAPAASASEASAAMPPADETTLVIPGAARLARAERAQLAFADKVATIAELRAARAARTVRALGLDPERLTSGGIGGPFVPWGKAGRAEGGVARLAEALDRLDRLERAILAVPSFKPAENSALSSRFGFRFDPFTRWPAMHQGQDFSGRHGEPIRAAAPGRIVRAGWWAGYGRAVEIDHGGGLRTRYAHLSGIDVRPGSAVRRGAVVGRMGSSGRSTGTHLHFEVRVDGRAVNPRPFLESSANVLEVQSRIRQRIDGARHAG